MAFWETINTAADWTAYLRRRAGATVEDEVIEVDPEPASALQAARQEAFRTQYR